MNDFSNDEDQKLHITHFSYFDNDVAGMPAMYFSIYKLPLDNMPCLVPNNLFMDRINTMTYGFKSNPAIPNPFRIQEIIPRNK